MSSHMAWEPVRVLPVGGGIGTNLKGHLALFVLGDKDAWTDLYGMDLGPEVQPFLMGYIAGAGFDASDAQAIVEAINEHGAVRVVRT